ncbi:MAG TPA: ABC transporter ATP-binding protein [Acidobacteriaceae bacterium]|nr:ABC transporter ATP-binding protein [Terriglobia bacterium]HVC91476.1 ABC transporter ATP-binding protein [Acidobacteriaceae bacterium]
MKLFLRLLAYARPYSLQAFASVVLMATVGLLDAFRVLLIKPIFDQVLKPSDVTPHLPLFHIAVGHRIVQLNLEQLVPGHFHNAWTMVAFAMVASTALKSLCDYLGTYLSNFAGYGMITDLRNDLYESILRRSVSFFQKHSTGTILSTLINDVERVQFAMSTVMSDFLQQFFTFLSLIAVVILYGGELAWVLLLFVPVVMSSARRIGRSVRTTTRSGQDKLAEIQNILHETVTGNRIVKAFNMEVWELVRFRTAARRLFRANLRSVSAQAISSPLMDLIGAIAIAMLLLLGRTRIQQHAMTEGAFIAFIFASFKLYDPVRKFALFYNNFQQAFGASSSIFDFMDAQDDVREKPHAVQLKTFQQAVCFNHVSFAYSDDEGTKQVLHDITLTVNQGEVIALVGPSGAGKTTIVNLIPRFFDVSSGQITIDGHDLRDVTLHSLRTQIAKVTQETILFNDTVRNNIAYGQPDVPKQQIIDAAKAALAHDFIEQMPEGYDTIIGEKGFRMSGGERQRLAIARALLKDAPILILDEATSALDAESESLVQAALANLMRRRTVFVIAHRLSTVRRANRIAVIEDGSITAIGTYEELLMTSPTFQKLHQLQFFDISEAAVAARNHR